MPPSLPTMHLSIFLFFITYVFAITHPAANFLCDAPLNSNTKITSQIKILTGNLTGYYYSTAVFYQTGFVGYFGFQPIEGQYLQKLSFSAFGDGPFSDHPNCHDGADEGPGVTCAAWYPFQFNKTYTFVQERVAHDVATGDNTWEGSVIDDETGELFVVANYTTPGSYGLFIGDAYCFDEYYPYNALTTSPQGWGCL